jgi:Tfp pilus assembly protein PilF
MKKLHLAFLAGALAVSACAPAHTLNMPQGHDVPPSASKTSLDHLAGQPQTASGVRLYQQARYRQASEELERELEVQPANYRAAYLLGMSYLQRNRYEDARDAFRLALELGPDRKTACHIHNGMAYSYEASRQSKMAHYHYHLACHFNKANGYAQQGAARTEYRHEAPPKPRPYARSGGPSKRPTG